MTMLDGVCECCKRKRDLVGVASSGIGPVSLAWCRECLANGAEPLDLVAIITDGLDKEAFGDIIVFHNDQYKTFGEVPDDDILQILRGPDGAPART